jgi:hypothetical protein
MVIFLVMNGDFNHHDQLWCQEKARVRKEDSKVRVERTTTVTRREHNGLVWWAVPASTGNELTSYA